MDRPPRALLARRRAKPLRHPHRIERLAARTANHRLATNDPRRRSFGRFRLLPAVVAQNRPGFGPLGVIAPASNAHEHAPKSLTRAARRDAREGGKPPETGPRRGRTTRKKPGWASCPWGALKKIACAYRRSGPTPAQSAVAHAFVQSDSRRRVTCATAPASMRERQPGPIAPRGGTGGSLVTSKLAGAGLRLLAGWLLRGCPMVTQRGSTSGRIVERSRCRWC